MNCIFSSIFILLFSFTAATQGAFYLKHNVPLDHQVMSISECEKGFLCVGSSEHDNKTNGYLMFLDLNGTILWEKVNPTHQPDNYEQYNSVVYHNNYFYIGGLSHIDAKNYNILTKIDLQGNLIYKKTIGTPSILGFDNYLTKLLISNDGILMATSGVNVTHTQGELIQVDFNGSIVWEHQYFSNLVADSNYWEYFVDMRPNGEHHSILLLSSQKDNIDFSYKTLLKVAENGQEVWRKSFNTYTPSLLTQDSLFLMQISSLENDHILGYFSVYSTVEEGFRSDFAIIEYDTDGNEINYTRFYNANGFGNSSIYTDETGTISLAGTRQFEDSLRLSVLKINEVNAIERDKTYYQKNSSIVNSDFFTAGEVFNFGIPTSDHGFILAGIDLYEIDHQLYFNSSILKTDCEGNLEWDYSRCISPKFSDVMVFPNPTTEHIHVQIPGLQLDDLVEIRLIDVLGRIIVFNTFTSNKGIFINTSELSIGAYICQVVVNKKLIKTEKIVKN